MERLIDRGITPSGVNYRIVLDEQTGERMRFVVLDSKTVKIADGGPFGRGADYRTSPAKILREKTQKADL